MKNSLSVANLPSLAFFNVNNNQIKSSNLKDRRSSVSLGENISASSILGAVFNFSENLEIDINNLIEELDRHPDNPKIRNIITELEQKTLQMGKSPNLNEENKLLLAKANIALADAYGQRLGKPNIYRALYFYFTAFKHEVFYTSGKIPDLIQILKNNKNSSDELKVHLNKIAKILLREINRNIRNGLSLPHIILYAWLSYIYKELGEEKLYRSFHTKFDENWESSLKNISTTNATFSENLTEHFIKIRNVLLTYIVPYNDRLFNNCDGIEYALAHNFYLTGDRKQAKIYIDLAYASSENNSAQPIARFIYLCLKIVVSPFEDTHAMEKAFSSAISAILDNSGIYFERANIYEATPEEDQIVVNEVLFFDLARLFSQMEELEMFVEAVAKQLPRLPTAIKEQALFILYYIYGKGCYSLKENKHEGRKLTNLMQMYLEKCIKFSSNNRDDRFKGLLIESHISLGRAYEILKKTKNYHEHLNAATRIGASVPTLLSFILLTQLGEMWRKAGKQAKAIQCYTSIISAELPENFTEEEHRKTLRVRGNAIYKLGLIAIDEKRYDEAEKHFNESKNIAEELNFNHLKFNSTVGFVAINLLKWEEYLDIKDLFKCVALMASLRQQILIKEAPNILSHLIAKLIRAALYTYASFSVEDEVKHDIGTFCTMADKIENPKLNASIFLCAGVIHFIHENSVGNSDYISVRELLNQAKKPLFSEAGPASDNDLIGLQLIFLFFQALIDIAKHEYVEAARSLDAILPLNFKLDKTDESVNSLLIHAAYYRARIYFEEAKYSQSRDQFLEALQLIQNSAVCYSNVLTLKKQLAPKGLTAKPRVDDELSLKKKLISVSLNHSQIYYFIARTLLHTKELSKALVYAKDQLEVYKRLIVKGEAFPIERLPNLLKVFADIAYQSGDLRQSQKCLTLVEAFKRIETSSQLSTQECEKIYLLLDYKLPDPEIKMELVKVEDYYIPPPVIFSSSQKRKKTADDSTKNSVLPPASSVPQDSSTEVNAIITTATIRSDNDDIAYSEPQLSTSETALPVLTTESTLDNSPDLVTSLVTSTAAAITKSHDLSATIGVTDRTKASKPKESKQSIFEAIHIKIKHDHIAKMPTAELIELQKMGKLIPVEASHLTAVIPEEIENDLNKGRLTTASSKHGSQGIKHLGQVEMLGNTYHRMEIKKKGKINGDLRWYGIVVGEYFILYECRNKSDKLEWVNANFNRSLELCKLLNAQKT